MKKTYFITFIVALVLSTQAYSLPFSGADITIWDGDGVNNEDNETEPGMVHSQEWDLEGFWLQDNNKLAIVGGFDFKNGVAGYNGGAGQRDFRAGDIFIDVDGDYIAGTTTGSGGQDVVKTTFGYDFVIDIDWVSGAYVVRELTINSFTQEAYYNQNYGSNPWKYAGEEGEGGSVVIDSGLELGNGVFSYAASSVGDGVDWVYNDWSGTAGAGFHNTAYNFDLSGIFAKGHTDLTFHNTMGCGNDNLMGHATVSEPSSIALLALGLIGLSVLRKKTVK